MADMKAVNAAELKALSLLRGRPIVVRVDYDYQDDSLIFVVKIKDKEAHVLNVMRRAFINES